MKFSITDFFSKCDQIHRKLWIWSNLLTKSLLENSIFSTVAVPSTNIPKGTTLVKLTGKTSSVKLSTNVNLRGNQSFWIWQMLMVLQNQKTNWSIITPSYMNVPKTFSGKCSRKTYFTCCYPSVITRK